MKMKSQTLSEKLPFYQKVLNLTLGLSASPSVRKDDPCSSPFRRGYTTPRGHQSQVIRSPSTPVKASASVASSTSVASSIFRSFRRRSLRRSFRRTKSFLVKNTSSSSSSSSSTTPNASCSSPSTNNNISKGNFISFIPIRLLKFNLTINFIDFLLSYWFIIWLFYIELVEFIVIWLNK